MEKKPSKTVIQGRNILGFFAGLIAGVLGMSVAGIIFGFILSFPIISNFLFWPVTPILVATTGSCGLGIYAALKTAVFICAPNEKGVRMGCVVLGWLIIVYFGICTISWVFTAGLFSDYAWAYLASTLMGFLVVSAGNGEEKE